LIWVLLLWLAAAVAVALIGRFDGMFWLFYGKKRSLCVKKI